MANTKEIKNLTVKDIGFNELTQDALGSGEWEQEINAFLDSNTLKGTFYNDDWVFLVNDLVAEHFSASPMCLMEQTFVNEELVVEKVDEHPVYDFLDRPNPFQDYASWQYNWAIEYNLMGNGIEWWNEDTTIALVVPAEAVMLDFDREGNLDAYVVSRRTDEVALGRLDKNAARFEKEAIFHQMRPNPASLLWGLSPFLAPRKSILFNRYTQDYINSFYLRGATPGMVLEMENNISEEGALRILRSFEQAHTGRRNNRRTMLLPKGVKANVVTPTMGDQQIIELTESAQHRILSALKVPKHAFSLAESGSLGSEEHKQALRFFFKSAIIPLQKKRAGFLTMKLRERGYIEPSQYLEFDNSHIDFLQDDMLKKAELGEKLHGQWTVNEIRAEIWDKEPLEGGDTLLIPQPSDDETVERSLVPHVLPQPQEEVEVETAELPELEEDKALTKRSRNKAALLEKYSEYFEYQQKEMGKEIDEKESGLMELFLERLARQVEKVFIPIITEQLENISEPAESSQNQKADTDIPNKVKLPGLRAKTEKELKKANAKLDEDLEFSDLSAYTEALEGTATRSYSTQIRPSFEPDRIDALTVLRDQDAQGRRTQLEARGLRSFEFVDETSIRQVMDTVEAGVQQRKTIVEIADDIKSKFGEGAPGRAATIARTETLTAVSIGKAAAMDAMQEVFDDEPVVKVWLTADDEKVRESHKALDGDIKKVGQKFDNGLKYPREVSAPPEEVINCRCDVSAFPLSELEFIPDLQPSEFK